MSLQPAAPARPPEVVQREHELNQALEAARALQARLELLGDRATDVVVVVSLRASLAHDIVVNGLGHNRLSDVEGDALTRQALLVEDEVPSDG